MTSEAAVQNGKILQEIDTAGLTILPALVDPHVHFRTPGAEHKENWLTGAQAAFQGGVTTVIDMPNNTPSCTTLEELQNKKRRIQEQLREAGIPLRYFLYIGADRNHLKEIPKAKNHAIGIKIFMGSSTGDLLIDDEPTLDEIFRMAADLDMLVSVHAEDEQVIRANKKLFTESLAGTRSDPAIHSTIRSPQAACKAIECALSLTAKHGTRLCLLHLSTQEELALLKSAKSAGMTVYGEAAPHHLFLSNHDYQVWGTRVQVNPPLREIEDQKALWSAINDGTIDFIGTDHAPHTLSEKAQPYGLAPSGIPSIELLLPLLLNAVSQGKMSLSTLIKITRTNIERIFRLPPNDDVVLVDLNRMQVVQDTTLKTKCGWSPYCGRILKGWPSKVIIHGKVFECHQDQDKPIYNIDKSYADNVCHGPVFDKTIPKYERPPESQWIDFLGYRIASPIGVPAGPLLNSAWTTLAARLGFDVVTYKTIRSQSHPGHPLPNVLFVEQCEGDRRLAKVRNMPESIAEISITNSFGMPSMSPEFIQDDIAKARTLLQKGQLLIVSVVGTPGYSPDVIQDFVRTALIAKEAGAQVIEANFSCPNISSTEGSLFCDPESSFQIATQLVKAVAPLPVLIKVGYYPDPAVLRSVLKGLARANVGGVCGINGLSMNVVNEDFNPALGKGRESSGICGSLIRAKALNFLREAKTIIQEEKLDLELVGCGGIMEPHHFNDFFEAGAKVAMTATGMMWDPYLSVKWQSIQKNNEAGRNNDPKQMSNDHINRIETP